MPQTALYTGEQSGGTIYRIGRIGFDSGNQDLGSHTYTAKLKTERITPAGEDGLVHFRRVSLRMLKTGGFTVTIKVFVDDDQTQVYDNNQSSSPLTTQSIDISESSTDLRETTIEADIDEVGTAISVELIIDSNEVSGLFLVESITAHGRALRETAARGESESE